MGSYLAGRFEPSLRPGCGVRMYSSLAGWVLAGVGGVFKFQLEQPACNLFNDPLILPTAALAKLDIRQSHPGSLHYIL